MHFFGPYPPYFEKHVYSISSTPELLECRLRIDCQKEVNKMWLKKKYESGLEVGELMEGYLESSFLADVTISKQIIGPFISYSSSRKDSLACHKALTFLDF